MVVEAFDDFHCVAHDAFSSPIKTQFQGIQHIIAGINFNFKELLDEITRSTKSEVEHVIEDFKRQCGSKVGEFVKFYKF